MDICYKYWCSSEKEWIYEWRSSIPTTCKNNENHTISDVSIYRELQPNGREVIIAEQNLFNKGYDYFAESVYLNISTDSIIEKSMSFPFNIYLYSVHLYPYCIGSDDDTIDVCVNPDFTCGILTTGSNIGDSIFNISETVIKYAYKPGWFIVTLVNGENSEELGRIIDINRTNLTIKTEKSSTMAFNIGTYVKISYYMMKNFELIQNNVGITTGDSKIGASFIPKNTTILIRYKNNSGIPKKFLAKLEYTW